MTHTFKSDKTDALNNYCQKAKRFKNISLQCFNSFYTHIYMKCQFYIYSSNFKKCNEGIPKQLGTPSFHRRDMGVISGLGTKIPQAM